jgi:hypothetical protein
VLKSHLSELFLPRLHESATDRRNRQLHDVSLALSAACCALHILTGWRKSGLHPFDPQKALSSPMIVENSISKPAPKPVKGQKRVAMHSGTIVSDGLAVPKADRFDPPESSVSAHLPPKRAKLEVVSNDGNVITIQIN